MGRRCRRRSRISGALTSNDDLDERDVLAVLLTGGTTGAPKEVIVSRRGTFRLIEAQRLGQTGARRTAVDGSRPGHTADRFNAIATPLFHLIGLKSLLFAWTHNRAVVVMQKFDALKYTDLVAAYRVDNLFLLPTMVYDLLEADLPADSFAHVKYAVVGGQALAEDLRRRFVEWFDVPILTHYGSTEVGAVAGWSLADLRNGCWRFDSVGRVYPGVTVHIRDAAGGDMPLGEPGEIVVRSDASVGYVGAAPDEALRDHTGWIPTGDVGYLDKAGCLFLVGAAKGPDQGRWLPGLAS